MDSSSGSGSDDGVPSDSVPLEAAAHGALNREFYFPTGIFFRDFPDAPALNDDLTRHIRAQRTQDETGIERSNVAALGGWHSHDVLHRDADFDTLTARIRAMGAEISTNCGYHPEYELQIDNMWAIINPPGSYNRSHVHPGCLWSGVYYVRAPKDAGRIVFYDPRVNNVMLGARFDPNRNRDPEHWVEVYFEPLPGRLVMFPSWLYHAVEPNVNEGSGEDAERICISFNMFQGRSKTT